MSDSANAHYGVCAGCGTAVLRRPDLLGVSAASPLISEIYDERYWNAHQADIGLDSVAVRARIDLTERCLYWLQHVLRFAAPPRRVLEVGCGHGALLKLLSMAGYECVGVEMNADIVATAQKWFGVNVVRGPVESLGRDLGEFDVVLLFDVLEHLSNPLETLTTLRQLLSKDGLMVLQSPEFRPDRPSAWPMFLPPEHLFLYTRASVSALLGSIGLSNVAFERAFFPTDFFVFASAVALAPAPNEQAVRRLLDSGDGRAALGMLEMFATINRLRDQQFHLERALESKNSVRGVIRTARAVVLERLRRAVGFAAAAGQTRGRLVRQPERAVITSGGTS